MKPTSTCESCGHTMRRNLKLSEIHDAVTDGDWMVGNLDADTIDTDKLYYEYMREYGKEVWFQVAREEGCGNANHVKLLWVK